MRPPGRRALYRYVIDRYATKYDQYTTSEFVRGVSLLLAGAVGVAFVSRLAKNFQNILFKLGKLIKKKHTIMCKRNFAGARERTSSD